MYKIVFTKRAIKDLGRIDAETKTRIGSKLKVLMSDPHTNSKKLSNPIIGTLKFRVGDYRVIFDIENDSIIILRIGYKRIFTNKNLYTNFKNSFTTFTNSIGSSR